MNDAVEKAKDWVLKKMQAAEPDFSSDCLDWDEAKDIARICVAASEESYEVSGAELLEIVEECKKLTFDSNEGVVRTPKRLFQIVSHYSFQSFRCGDKLQLPALENGIQCTFHHRSFFVGFAALKAGAFHYEFQEADAYPCIEVYFPKPETRPGDDADKEFVESALFELAAEGHIFRKSPFQFFDDMPGDEVVPPPKFRPLEQFNEGIRLFNAAVTVDDSDLRFLSLYKVLEFFAPVVVRLERNDALRKKLDSPMTTHPDANFLESLFELSIAAKDWAKDSELPRQVLSKCIDFVELAAHLPKPLQKTLSYDPKKRSEVETQIKTVADALYATRNRVAHAKSNHNPQGSEIAGGDMDILNGFMEFAAVQTIRWFNRLPKHQRHLF